MDKTAEIAAELTKAQREALLNSVPLSGPTSDRYLHVDCDEDVARELYLDDCVTFRDRLTPLGLSILAILQEQSNAD